MSKGQDEIAGAGAGAATGAGIGSAAGPEGALIGGILGALIGAALGSIPHTHGDSAKAAPDPLVNMDYDFETPHCTPDMIMWPVNKRAPSPIETPKPKVQDRQDVNLKFRGPGSKTRTVTHTGPAYTADYCRDFSALQRTRLNPVTGRIIGYKGIPRKRALSPTSKYSSFWRDQKHAKTSFHAARSPGVWDSARRP